MNSIYTPDWVPAREASERLNLSPSAFNARARQYWLKHKAFPEWWRRPPTHLLRYKPEVDVGYFRYNEKLKHELTGLLYDLYDANRVKYYAKAAHSSTTAFTSMLPSVEKLAVVPNIEYENRIKLAHKILKAKNPSRIKELRTTETTLANH
jgi:hypothetical protein